MMKIGARIFMVTLDGEWHRLGDIAGHLTSHIDPSQAVRAYQTMGSDPSPNRGENTPVDYKIIKGRRRIIRNTLWKMAEKEHIEIDTHGTTIMDDEWRIRITPAGVDHVNGPGGFRKLITEEMVKLARSGRADIMFKLRDGAGTVGTGVTNE